VLEGMKTKTKGKYYDNAAKDIGGCGRGVVCTANKGPSTAATKMREQTQRLVIACTAGPASWLGADGGRRGLGATPLKRP
jgi:hypothetical protein